MDLSNVDQVPSNAHLSEKESQLYIFEDNEAVIKMIIQGRSPTRDEWHNVLHLLNIMNDTTFSCSHFSNSHSFLSAGKQSEMSKRCQERFSPGSPTAKARTCCLVSRENVSVVQIIRVTLKA